MRLEAETDRLRRERPQRRLPVASLTHGIENGLAASPTRWRCSSGSGSRTSTGCVADSSRSGSTATSRRPASSRSRSSRTRSTGSTRRRSCSRRYGHDVEVLDRAADPAPRSTRRPTSAARGTAPARRLVDPPGSPSGSPRRRPGRRRASTSARRLTAHERPGGLAAGRTAGRARSARGASLLATNAYPPLRGSSPLRRAGLRLRAGDRAALRRASAPRSAGSAARASATSATSSTTTG